MLAVPESLSHALVDDDPDFLRAKTRELAADGHRVRSYASGPELLRCLDGRDPVTLGHDAVLLDYRMPGCDGPEVLAQLSERNSPLAAVVITAGVSEIEEQIARGAGALGVIDKFRMDIVLHWARVVAFLTRARRDGFTSGWPQSGISAETMTKAVGRTALVKAHALSVGNLSAAGRLLARDRSNLRRQLKEHGLDPADFVPPRDE